MTKYWLLNHPRPTGIEPTIYSTKPIFDSDDLYSSMISFIECQSIGEALKIIFDFNHTDEYIENLEIK